MSKFCNRCGSAMDDDDLFCGKCGSPWEVPVRIKRSCPNCGAAVEEGEAFCGSCGAPVRAAPEKAGLPLLRAGTGTRPSVLPRLRDQRFKSIERRRRIGDGF